MSATYLTIFPIAPRNDKQDSFPLFISVLVHALILAILFIILLNQHQKSTLGETGPIEIESINKPAKTRMNGVPKASGAIKSVENQSTRVIPLSALGMRMDSGNPVSQSVENSSEKSTAVNDMNLLQVDPELLNEDPSIMRVASYLDRTINGAMKYYARYFHENMNGIVKVNLCFSENGEYLGNDEEKGSSFEAEDKDFKALAQMIVRRELKEPIPRQFLSLHKKFCIPGYFTRR